MQICFTSFISKNDLLRTTIFIFLLSSPRFRFLFRTVSSRRLEYNHAFICFPPGFVVTGEPLITQIRRALQSRKLNTTYEYRQNYV